jgi:putative serine protease PepD
MNRRSPLLGAAALVAAGLVGGALALVGAAALGIGGATTTVEQLDASGAGSPAAFERSGAPQGALSVNDIFRRDAPGVVQVTSTQVVKTNDPFSDPFFGFGPQTQKQTALGSGFVLDKAGHIVTNYHVIANAQKVEVSFSNSDNMKAKIVGADPSTDIAVIKVDAPASVLHPLSLGDSSSVQVGQAVVAIGSPFGLPETVTAGIVSALHREMTAPNNFTIADSIQTDAAINHGNSGGPLLDLRGEVIGITSQIQSEGGGNDGVGFAVPSNTVKSIASQLISNGKAEHALLGVTPADTANGVRIATVKSGSAADDAGLKEGDVITAVGSTEITSSAQIRAIIAGKQPGDALTLTIRRDGSTKTVHVTLGSRS